MVAVAIHKKSRGPQWMASITGVLICLVMLVWWSMSRSEEIEEVWKGSKTYTVPRAYGYHPGWMSPRVALLNKRNQNENQIREFHVDELTIRRSEFLSSVLSQSVGMAQPEPMSWAISQRGEVGVLNMRSGAESVEVYNIDSGTRTGVYDLSELRNVARIIEFYFSPDGSRWIVTGYSGATIHGAILDPKQDKVRVVELMSALGMFPIGFTSESTFLVLDGLETKGIRKARLIEIELSDQVAVGRELEVKLPYPCTIQMAKLSPDGSRILWGLRAEGWLSDLDRRAGSMLKRREHRDMDALWVSESDGSELHLVGAMQDSDFYRLRWTPDGESVSVLEGEKLLVRGIPRMQARDDQRRQR